MYMSHVQNLRNHQKVLDKRNTLAKYESPFSFGMKIIGNVQDIQKVKGLVSKLITMEISGLVIHLNIYICPVFSLLNVLAARVHSFERGCTAM